MGWSYYAPLVTDHTQCGASDSNNFTVAFDITDASLKTVANGGAIHNTALSNGQTVPADFGIFANNDGTGTAYNFEIKFYDGTLGRVVGFYLIPILSHTVDITVYALYGDIAVTTFQGNVPATWNSSYVAVWHFPNGTTLAARDSTGNGHDGVITSAVGDPTFPGGDGLYNGTSAKIVVPASIEFLTNPFTLSQWFKTSEVSSFLNFFCGPYNNVAPDTGSIFFQTTSKLNFIIFGVTTAGTPDINDNVWHYAVGTWDGNTLQLFIDGILDQSTGGHAGTPPGGSTVDFQFGIDAANSLNFYNGLLAETRFQTGVISADQVLAEYNNQKPGSTFITFGPAVPIGPPPPVTDMAYTQALQLGLSTTILQNIVYALPARACFVQSSAAVEVSNIIDTGFVTLTNANTVGAQTAATWLRCTTGNCVVSCKAL